MLKQIWRVRAALAYRRITGLTLTQAWGFAGALADDYRPDGYSPTEAVREDITYWQT
ncbi:hypothetical protein [Achromobacter spanius]|uniref:hypothetical protein n=1 Tax=Achromobacter spanius TaxID=217203 RepID=UPI000FA34327